MSYLCIDVEWNIPDDQSVDMELISIGAACWDSVNRFTRTYFKLMRPERMDMIRPLTYRLLNLGPVVLEQAKPCEEVLKNFVETFSGREYLDDDSPIVLWHQDDWNFLKQNLDKYGLSLLNNRIIILQDVITFSGMLNTEGQPVGFEAALQAFGVFYRPELLHNSKYDAQYLIDLYDAVYDDLMEAGSSLVPLIHTVSSKTLHHSGCRYLEGRTIVDGSWEDALNGWSLCKCCGRKVVLDYHPEPKYISENTLALIASIKPRNSVKNPPRKKTQKAKRSKGKITLDALDEAILKFGPLNEDCFIKHCKSLEIECHMSFGWAFLTTPVSSWKIQYDGTKVLQVLHQSMKISRDRIEKEDHRTHEGYHQQRIFHKDIFGVATYIYEHDKHFLQPEYKPSYWRGKRLKKNAERSCNDAVSVQ